MKYGFFRVAAAIPEVTVADTTANASSIIELAHKLDAEKVSLAVMPELCVTGYTCGDLFHQAELLDSSEAALNRIAVETASLGVTLVVGAPCRYRNALYNCGVVISHGKIVLFAPKTYLPNYNEFYEKRLWTSGLGIEGEICLPTQEEKVPFSSNRLFEVNGVKIGIEVCEDLWVPIPPSSHHALSGADIIVNLSASNDLVSKYSYLTALIANQSARNFCAYVYASAGFGESTTDLVFDGKAIIAENGVILASNPRWQMGAQFEYADIHVEALRFDRMHHSSFHDCASAYDVIPTGPNFMGSSAVPVFASTGTIELPDGHELPSIEVDGVEVPVLRRKVNPMPFVPSQRSAGDLRCSEVVNIQTLALAQRLKAVGCKTLVIGISGGLDSTLALLIAVRAFDRLELPRTGIKGVTMPGFGTSSRTRTNAIELMEKLGIDILEIPIGAAVTQHFKDINHDMNVHDVTYENSQARERTQILMDLSNKFNGMVLGTGDMSELALGWATYNGDHMSMYGVNASVPKTLVRRLVEWIAGQPGSEEERRVLLDIVDTPISPELTPADSEGNIAQITEDLVGPYQLHDFFLYNMLRFGLSPESIYRLAANAFIIGPEEKGEKPVFEPSIIKHWLKVFYTRFFTQQFKRSCLPDGPKVGSISLSPRGDWRMPSDASRKQWMKFFN